jgi:hypothetical protein
LRAKMVFLLNTILRAVCFEFGVIFGTFVVPIMLHACFGMPYIN